MSVDPTTSSGPAAQKGCRPHREKSATELTGLVAVEEVLRAAGPLSRLDRVPGQPRAEQHHAVSDYFPQRWAMERAAILLDRPLHLRWIRIRQTQQTPRT